MKKIQSLLTNTFRIRNKKLRIANYLTSGFLLLYLALIIHPNVLFGHSLTYKNFKIYSREPLTEELKTILDQASSKLSSSELNKQDQIHSVYICNSFSLFTFFAPFSRSAFACNYPVVNNIFIAKSDIKKNEAYKNDRNDNYVRQLSSLIAHESTHTLIEQKIGFMKFKSLSNWQNEGYCDFVAYGSDNDFISQKEFLATTASDKRPGTLYRRYYLAMNYLITIKGMSFEEIVSGKMELEEVLQSLAKYLNEITLGK